MTAVQLEVATESFEIAGGFRIARGARTHAHVVTATLRAGADVGRGECTPYPRYGESVEGVMETIRAMAGPLAKGLDRAALQDAMPPGAARNALDCAFWDLEAKRRGVRAWDLAGLPPSTPAQTVFTLSLDAPQAMQAKAAANAHRPLLKVKLGGPQDGGGDLDRLAAVRAGAPDAVIVVDANEGWSADDYSRLAPEMVRLGVAMVEQPLPAGDDAALADLDRPLPVCADEACHGLATLDALRGKYDMVNIKLDKTGGLTEALRLRDAARAAGFKVMVGCMMGTSLALAPAHLVAQGADLADLDAALLLSQDRPHGLVYDAQGAHPPDAALWG